MIISYSTQAAQALDGLAVFDRAAYVLAMLRIQGHLVGAAGDGVVRDSIAFVVDDDAFTLSFVATVTGVEIGVHELDWEVCAL
ncbi:hypothetical protein QMK19_41000 [Streptomyces sp. H10-C2]|uniref:hypothetical protein n=1 Tax=unclassified Streptomyces TaxID=2593676 RepID=UPI0024B9117C|nr:MULTISPECIES: hypothetical protein [unclassified Streptomyces]MDJ0346809.1 hypothetical protein [Streptomyces sp. PH10-H1]MDJ0375777.1 hypothetical protein [Streptomyces sp. H10-C2]